VISKTATDLNWDILAGGRCWVLGVGCWVLSVGC